MVSKLYVGNLSFSATEQDIRDLFAQHGQVHSVSLIADRETGRPRGFGFVEMENAAAAMAALNGADFQGRPLKVSEARSQREGGGGGGPGQGKKRADRSW